MYNSVLNVTKERNAMKPTKKVHRLYNMCKDLKTKTDYKRMLNNFRLYNNKNTPTGYKIITSEPIIMYFPYGTPHSLLINRKNYKIPTLSNYSEVSSIHLSVKDTENETYHHIEILPQKDYSIKGIVFYNGLFINIRHEKNEYIIDIFKQKFNVEPPVLSVCISDISSDAEKFAIEIAFNSLFVPELKPILEMIYKKIYQLEHFHAHTITQYVHTIEDLKEECTFQDQSIKLLEKIGYVNE